MADSSAAAAEPRSGSDSDADEQQQQHRSKKRKAVSDDVDDDDGDEQGDADEDDAAAADGEEGGGDGGGQEGGEDDGEEDDEGESRKSSKSKKHKKHRKEKRPGSQFIDAIAVNDDDEDESDEESEDEEEEEEDNGDGEPDDGEDLEDEGQRRRDDAEGDSDDEARALESPAQRKARRKAEKLARRRMGGVDLSQDDETMHMTLDQIREREEAEKLRAEVEDHYRGRGGGYDDYDDDGGANGRSRGSVLPSIKDPSVFLIKLKRGVDEREALRALLKEFQVREDGKDESRRLLILSAFTTPASKGCIYVEAEREAHLKSALQSVPLGRSLYSYYANSSTNIKVPIQEMVSALKFRSEEVVVKEKQWVRLKRGPFKDDLARVVRLQDQGAVLTLKIIPRINFLWLDAKRANDKLSLAEFTRSRPDLARERPPQKLFDPAEMRSYGATIERKRGTGAERDTTYYTWNNMKFKNGFMFKDFKQLDGVLPTAAELDAFASRALASDDEDDESDRDDEAEGGGAGGDTLAQAHAAAQAAPRRPVVYALGDRVVITGGALKNVTGRIRRIEKDRVHISPDNLRLGGDVQEVFAHVRKYFTVSTHVKVVAGVYKDESGMVTHVFDPEPGQEDDAEADIQLALHTDVSVRDIIVSSQDVIESSEISTGRDSFGAFELGDMVQLRGDLVGVIIRINVSSMVVLTSAGLVQDVKLQEVAFKRSDRFSRTTDKFGQTLELNDVVYPLAGPHRGKKATVKHIFKRVLFLNSPLIKDNAGLFTIRGDQVTLPQNDSAAGGRQQAPKSPSAGSRSPGPAPRSPGPHGSGYGGGGAGAGAGAGAVGRAGPRVRDPLIGKDVKITGGQYKGYAGVCLDVVDGQARVEVRAVFRKVQVPRNQITLVEAAAARSAAAGIAGVMYGGATPLVGGATPAHTGFGSATPGYEMGGSMTPFGAGGSRTPSHRTPSHGGDGGDVWAPQTPAHRQEDRMEEDNPQEEWLASMQESDMRTPGANPVTPGGAVPQTPRTPYAAHTPHEHAMPHDVDMVPQTPATPYDPALLGAAAAADAAAAAEEEEEHEAEAPMEAEPAAPAVPEGLFTHPECVGCHVTLVASEGVEADSTVHVITAIDEAYQVHVRPLSSSRDHPARVVPQSSLAPVRPSQSHSGKQALVLSAVQAHNAPIGPGTRLTLTSFMGNQILIADAEGNPDVIALEALEHLCLCEEKEAQNDDEEQEEEAAASSKKKTKGKVKKERKR